MHYMFLIFCLSFFYAYIFGMDKCDELSNIQKALSYQWHHFDDEIAQQPFAIASINFLSKSKNERENIITHLVPTNISDYAKINNITEKEAQNIKETRQLLVRTLQLPPDNFDDILSFVLPMNYKQGVISAFHEEKNKPPRSLGQAWNFFADAMEKSKSHPYLTLDTWSLLEDIPEQLEMVKKFNKDVEKYTFSSSQELGIVRSFPPQVKEQLQHISCTRDYEWQEKIGHITKEIKFDRTNCVVPGIVMTVAMSGLSFIVKDLYRLKQSYGKTILDMSFFSLSVFLTGSINRPCIDLFGERGRLIKYIVSLGSFGLISSLRNIDPIHFFMSGFFCGGMYSVDDYQPQPLKITNTLDKI